MQFGQLIVREIIRFDAGRPNGAMEGDHVERSRLLSLVVLHEIDQPIDRVSPPLATLAGRLCIDSVLHHLWMAECQSAGAGRTPYRDLGI